MINPLSVLINIDECVTNKLTTFCWWTDTQYGKDNIWWLKITAIIIFPLLQTIQETIRIMYSEKKSDYLDFSPPLFFIAGCMAILLVLYLCFRFIPYFQQILKNTEKIPNKNRTDQTFFYCKVAIPISATLNWVTPPSFILSTEFFDFASLISFELFLFFLCTEPTPPAIKRKKLEEIEIKRLQLIPQKN